MNQTESSLKLQQQPLKLKNVLSSKKGLTEFAFNYEQKIFSLPFAAVCESKER